LYILRTETVMKTWRRASGARRCALICNISTEY